MTGILLGALVAFAMATAIECYLLLGRVQLLFDHAELILRALHPLLRALPGKSAQQTVAAIDAKPRPWFQTLRRLAELRDHLAAADQAEDEPDLEEQVEVDDGQVDDVALARWEDDGAPALADPDDAVDAADDAPTDQFPAIDPPTLTAGLAIDVWQHTHIPARTELNDEPWRSRFDFSGGRRHRSTHPDGGD